MIQYKDRVAELGTDRIVISMPRNEWVSIGLASAILRFFGRSLTDDRLWSRIPERHRHKSDHSRMVRLDIALEAGAEMPDLPAVREASIALGKSMTTIQRMVNRGDLRTTRVDNRTKIIADTQEPALSAFEMEVLRAIRQLGTASAGQIVDEINRRRGEEA